jgi:hypothetical protein
VVFAQLVGSSFKKQTDNTVMLHREGYTGAPWGGHDFIPPHTPEGYVGYNLPAGTAVAQSFEFVPGGGMAGGGGVWKDIKVETGTPTVVLGHAEKPEKFFKTKDVKLLKIPPDFRYRLDYLEADRQAQQPLHPPSIPPFPSGMSRADAVKQYNQATNFYRDYSFKGISHQQIVGLNNIGEVTFERSTSGVGLGFVNHTLRWKVEDSVDFLWATWHVYMDPDDDVIYKNVKADNE